MTDTRSVTSGLGADSPSIADQTAIMDAVRILFRAIRLHNVEVERLLGISLAQLYVLEQLDGHPNASVNDLAELTRTHQSSVSVVVRKLGERGLVEKRTSSSDARRAELSLTDAGRKLLTTSPGTFQTRLQAGLREIGVDETRQLAANLSHWLKACGLDEVSPPMFFEDEPRGNS